MFLIFNQIFLFYCLVSTIPRFLLSFHSTVTFSSLQHTFLPPLLPVPSHPSHLPLPFLLLPSRSFFFPPSLFTPSLRSVPFPPSFHILSVPSPSLPLSTFSPFRLSLFLLRAPPDPRTYCPVLTTHSIFHFRMVVGGFTVKSFYNFRTSQRNEEKLVEIRKKVFVGNRKNK